MKVKHMASDKINLIMIGLPETGKTTFLAALWYVVNHSDEIPSALKLNKLIGNQVYLNRIQNQWLKYTPADRTLIDSEELVHMELHLNKGHKIAKVFFPDVSGERYRHQVEKRTCSKSYLNQIKEAEGALFFIHVGDFGRHNRIEELDELEELINNGSEKIGRASCRERV